MEYVGSSWNRYIITFWNKLTEIFNIEEIETLWTKLGITTLELGRWNGLSKLPEASGFTVSLWKHLPIYLFSEFFVFDVYSLANLCWITDASNACSISK